MSNELSGMDLIRSELTLGQLIRESREKRGIKLRPFAKRIGISFQHLSRIELDIDSPGKSTLLAIAKQLDSDGNYVLAKAKYLPPDVVNKIERHPELIEIIRKYSPANTS